MFAPDYSPAIQFRVHCGAAGYYTGVITMAWAWRIALLTVGIHLICNQRYGYFRDELYFLAAAEHLDWGYVDFAPLVAWIARLSRSLFGDSLSSIRLFPALAHGALVVLSGLLAREMGGGRYAAGLAAACTLLAGGYLLLGNFLSMNAFEPLFWMGFVLFILRALERSDPRWWLAAGVAAGLGLQNKHSMLFFGFAVTAGLILSPHRRQFLTPWPWLAGAIAIALFLPNLIWQAQRGFPTIELLRNVQTTGKNVVLNPVEFFGQQVLGMSPATILVWGAGLIWLLRSRFRWLGLSYVLVLAMLIAMKGKNYYLFPAYGMLFAGGGIAWEQRGRWARIAIPATVVLLSLPVIPIVLPVLEPAALVAYIETIGIAPPKTEVGHQGALPQHFGDQFGWPEMAAKVADVYRELPPGDRAKVAIFGSNYGEAGAIDFFGPALGLPKAISPHQHYWVWGPRDATGEVVIAITRTPPERLAQRFASCEVKARASHPFAMAEEQVPIYVCRGLNQPMHELWREIRVWN